MTTSHHGSKWNWTIALDGGTTNTRARLLDARGQVVAGAVRSVGVRNTALSSNNSDRSSELKHAVREVIVEALRSACEAGAIESPSVRPDAVVAAGMLTSDVGLCTVPHVPAPAGLEELARGVKVVHLPEVCESPIHFVPGIRTPAGPGPDGWMNGDVMRGEEVETFGVLDALIASNQLEFSDRSLPPAFLWPGSHTKLIDIDATGRIARSTTSLAGELTQAIWNHTLITASLPTTWPAELDEDAVEQGRRAASRYGLGRAAFLVRIAALSESLEPAARASFWIGAVLSDDAVFLANHPILSDTPERPVWVGGREPLRGILARFLKDLHRGEVHTLDERTSERASPLGALRIARLASTLV